MECRNGVALAIQRSQTLYVHANRPFLHLSRMYTRRILTASEIKCRVLQDSWVISPSHQIDKLTYKHTKQSPKTRYSTPTNGYTFHMDAYITNVNSIVK